MPSRPPHEERRHTVKRLSGPDPALRDSPCAFILALHICAHRGLRENTQSQAPYAQHREGIVPEFVTHLRLWLSGLITLLRIQESSESLEPLIRKKLEGAQ